MLGLCKHGVLPSLMHHFAGSKSTIPHNCATRYADGPRYPLPWYGIRSGCHLRFHRPTLPNGGTSCCEPPSAVDILRYTSEIGHRMERHVCVPNKRLPDAKTRPIVSKAVCRALTFLSACHDITNFIIRYLKSGPLATCFVSHRVMEGGFRLVENWSDGEGPVRRIGRWWIPLKDYEVAGMGEAVAEFDGKWNI